MGRDGREGTGWIFVSFSIYISAYVENEGNTFLYTPVKDRLGAGPGVGFCDSWNGE